MFHIGSFRAAAIAVVFFIAANALAQTAPTSAPAKTTDMSVTAPLPAASALPEALTVGAGASEATARTRGGRQGDTAWILTSAVLVVFMVFPGISLFYGGLVRRKNVISIYAQCVVIAAAAILSWVTISYSLAFSSTGGSFIGDFSRVGLTGITADSLFPGGEALEWPMVVFHLSFAIITAELVIG